MNKKVLTGFILGFLSISVSYATNRISCEVTKAVGYDQNNLTHKLSLTKGVDERGAIINTVKLLKRSNSLTSNRFNEVSSYTHTFKAKKFDSHGYANFYTTRTATEEVILVLDVLQKGSTELKDVTEIQLQINSQVGRQPVVITASCVESTDWRFDGEDN